jgi:hypothetical protein
MVPVYFAMLRIAPAVQEDLYDTLDKDGFLVRFTFGTRSGRDVELTQFFREKSVQFKSNITHSIKITDWVT